MNKAILLSVEPGEDPDDVLQIDPRLERLGYVTATWQLASGKKATLATFAGTWQAHGRTLKISRTGDARESISLGLGHFLIALRFRLSQPRGTPDHATARATVTAVRIGEDRGAFTTGRPPPRVGDSRRIRLRYGVITETLTGANYCGPTSGDWLDAGCGA